MAKKFLNAPYPVGQLYYDCILLDGDAPVLFTCKDIMSQLYYCVCIYNVIGAQEWLITKTTPKVMCDLLKNKITMRQAITVEDKIWFAKEKQDGCISWDYKSVEDFPDDYLPTDGMYMDANDDEFDEEIRHYNILQAAEDERDYQIARIREISSREASKIARIPVTTPNFILKSSPRAPAVLMKKTSQVKFVTKADRKRIKKKYGVLVATKTEDSLETKTSALYRVKKQGVTTDK